MFNVECVVWNVECVVWNVLCGMWNVKLVEANNRNNKVSLS